MIRSVTTVRVCWLGVSDTPFMVASGVSGLHAATVWLTCGDQLVR